jgi:hypothetical protein
VLTTREIDELCEFVLARLLADGASPDATAWSLVAHLALTHPGADALTPVLPLSMAAASLQEMLAGPEAGAQAQGVWRMAALIGAEVLALQAGMRREPPGSAVPCIGLLWSRMQKRPGDDTGA